MAANPGLHSRTKHIDIDTKLIRAKLNSGDLKITHIPTEKGFQPHKAFVYFALSPFEERAIFTSAQDVKIEGGIFDREEFLFSGQKR